MMLTPFKSFHRLAGEDCNTFEHTRDTMRHNFPSMQLNFVAVLIIGSKK